MQHNHILFVLVVLLTSAVTSCSSQPVQTVEPFPSPTSLRPLNNGPSNQPTTPTHLKPTHTVSPLVTETISPFQQDLSIQEADSTNRLKVYSNEVPEASGNYLLTLNYTGVVENSPIHSYFIEFFSPYTDKRGQILNIHDLQATLDFASLSTYEDIPVITLIDFQEISLTLWQIDITGTIQNRLTVEGPIQFPEPNRFIQTEYDPSFSVSPNGQWFVWDCSHDGQYNWCLVDLVSNKAWSILPGGGSSPHDSLPSFIAWAPGSQWFMAYCPDLDQVGHTTYCLVDPKEHSIKRWGYAAWERGEFPYMLQTKDISLDGSMFLDFRIDPSDEDSTLRQLTVVKWNCTGDKPCHDETVFSLKQPAHWSARWDAKGELIELDYSNYISEYSKDSGPTHVVVMDASGSSEDVLTESSPAGAEVISWSPDGKWFAMACGDKHPDETCILSFNGAFKPLVPRNDTNYHSFLGWLVIP